MARNTAREINDGTNRMSFDLLYAARVGDIDHAQSAIYEDVNCVTDTDEHGRNALQISIVNLQDNMANFLLDNTNIKTIDKDRFGKCALKLSLAFSEEALSSRVFEQWIAETAAAENVSQFPSP